MDKNNQYWEKIFRSSNFGDYRRNKRIMKIASTIENSFEKSASASLPDQGALKAASLFLNNASVTPKTISDSFIIDNMASINCKHVLLPVDRSEMNFSWRKKQLDGLGPVGNDKDQGFFIQPAIMVDPEKERVLGLAGIDLWTREYDRIKKNYKKKSFEEKESYKWLTLPEDVREYLPDDICMTVVTDREGDIYELFYHHNNGRLGENTELLIRACKNRNLENEEKYFFEVIDKLPVRGEYELKVNRSEKRTARTAVLEVKYEKITMSIPFSRSKKKFEPIQDIYVIDVREINPPASEELIHWTLLTTWEVNSLESALEKVRWYSCRWFIEELFRILKSGYKAEKAKFDNGNALMNWCTLKLMLAIRLLNLLTLRNIETPDSALPYFSSEEINILEYSKKKLISSRSKRYIPPTRSLAWAILIIAIMGGYKATPSALPPGQECLWRGLDKLETAVIGFKAATYIKND